MYSSFTNKIKVSTNKTAQEIEALGGSEPVLLLIHGAGESAETWTELVQYLDKYVVITFDLRSHGESIQGQEETLTLDVLVDDLLNIVSSLINNTPPIFLIGHSLGGAVAIHASLKKVIRNLKGVVVIDVVGGTAIETIAHMERFIEKIPPSFESVDRALEWSSSSRNACNEKHSRACIESRLVQNQKTKMYHWRTNLFKTKDLWTAWFHELSLKFLQVPASKFLILAGTDRLDKELMIGHMQGKFQLSIIPDCGHYIQEEKPEALARELITFVDRNAVVIIKRFSLT